MKTNHIIFFIIFIIFFQIICIAQENPTISKAEKPMPHLSGLYSSEGSFSMLDLSSKNHPTLPENFPYPDKKYVEQVEKRTLKTMSFVNDKGEIVIYTSSKNINYISPRGELIPLNPKLVKSQDGWSAIKQEFPTYLNNDLTTAISLNEANRINFNRNCRINNIKILTNDFTVGEEGAYINNAIPGIDKKIIFHENAVKTEYIIKIPPACGSSGLIISEEIEIPHGCFLKKVPSKRVKESYDYVVYSSDGIEKSRFQTPIFFDSNINNTASETSFLFSSYTLKQLNGKNILEFTIPYSWLNNPSRVYPLIIDPLITGPVSNYPDVFMNSCVLPNYASDSMLITIPGGVTISGFIVEDSYFAEGLASPPAHMNHGHMALSTSCGTISFSCNPTGGDLSGLCYLVPNTDLKTQLSCCFVPSCFAKTFYLTHSLARDSIYGTGCNQDYIYYNSLANWPFSAYVMGRTIESSDIKWWLSPETVCSDSCSVMLHVETEFGVPPYTVKHPWTNDSIVFGNSSDSCNSAGLGLLVIHIPGCQPFVSSLIIPPPIISDTCGNIVSGLTSKIVTLNPCTGVKENYNSNSISISPNPFTSQTNITFTKEQKNTTVKIIDESGKEIKRLDFKGKLLIIEKGEIPPGIYFIQFMGDNNNVVSRKIILQ